MKILAAFFSMLGALGIVILVAICEPLPSGLAPTVSDQDLVRHAREHLGKLLFFDQGLSNPSGTSCASCHDPSHAFSGNHGSTIGVALGSTPHAYGLRNTPGLTYSSLIPPFTADPEDVPLEPRGGHFLDGRVSFLDEQVEGPLLSPLEMNNHDRATVVAKVQARFASQFRIAFGPDIFDRGTRISFLAVGAALQAFESSAQFHTFSSRFDRYRRGTLSLTTSEMRGMQLFVAPDKGNCATCHLARLQVHHVVPLFSDFGYETLGVPRNRAIPANADPTFFDLGLGGPKRILPRGDPSFDGAFRTPILRNVAVKPAFMHNGIFTTLQEVVLFYATRDSAPAHWYPSGTPFDDTPLSDRQYINTGVPFGGRPGDVPHLQGQEVLDLVAFLRALTDQEYESALPPMPTLQSLPRLGPDGVPTPPPAQAVVGSCTAAAPHQP